MMMWYENESYDPVILCSKRVSVRNVLDFKFVDRMTDTEGVTFRNAVDAIFEGFDGSENFLSYDLPNEKNTITEKFTRNGIITTDGRIWKNAEMYYSDEKGVYVTINVDDHIRIIDFIKGLPENFDRGLENYLYEKIFAMYDVAKDKSGNLLSSCIDEAGSGCVYSTLLHLPIFETMGNEFNKKRREFAEIGISMTEIVARNPLQSFGLQGFYNISFSPVFGKEESQLQKFIELCSEIAKFEVENRKFALANKPSFVIDDICKAFGYLSGALMLNYSEAIALLSRIKLGYDLGLCPTIKPEIFLKLIFETTDPCILEKIIAENPLFPVDVKDENQKIEWYRCKIFKDIFSEGVLYDKRFF